MSRSRTFRVLLIESSEVVSAGLVTMLTSTHEFSQAYAIDDLELIEESFYRVRPDAIVLNPGLLPSRIKGNIHEMLGIPDPVPVVALSYGIYPENIMSLFSENISIYDDSKTIIRKLSVLCSTHNVDTDIAHENELSVREKEILIAVSKGLMNKEIADMFNISIHTVITHRKNITRKTGIKSVAGLTVYAIMNGLLNMNELERL